MPVLRFSVASTSVAPAMPFTAVFEPMFPPSVERLMLLASRTATNVPVDLSVTVPVKSLSGLSRSMSPEPAWNEVVSALIELVPAVADWLMPTAVSVSWEKFDGLPELSAQRS